MDQGDERLDRGLDRRVALSGLVAAAWLSSQQTPPETAQALSVNSLTRMAATVRVDGHEALFVLDTGAERTAIAADLAASLGLPAGPGLVVHGVTAAEIVASVVLGRLSFGGRRFRHLVAPALPRRSLAADGLVGLDVLSSFTLEVDLIRREVRIRPAGDRIVTGVPPTRLPRETGARTGRFGQLILLNSRVEGRPVDAFVDSGAQYSIGNLALLSSLDGTTTRDGIDVYGVTGQRLAARLGQVRDLTVGGRSLGETPLLFADLHAFEALGLADRPALLLGADVLYRFDRVMLDYGRGRVAFGAVRPSFAPPPATRQG
ncbi:retroviral-like aspartic protease family protein [Brevundimonas bacteroides]|uniref:retroviral-like aspartic protease family protein n=1 Tax=Brevundimonas bacteroides TaxID=74311 RepID=UPI00049733B8|nr:retroviral-like aspartic protease family protein [Brevundimonas bacteroides]